MGSMYRDSIAATLSAALAVGVGFAAADALIALGRADGDVDGGELFAVITGLYAAPATVFGVVVGLVGAAFARTHGRAALARAVRRLRGDPALDTALAGAILAGAGAA
ncbi:MAG: hypothetical protein AAGC55_31145, partial [Myxococcota bacterium]